MKKKVTAAVVIINRDGDILGCHGTGKPKDSGLYMNHKFNRL